jgi:uncharacterized membrane protein (UPF0136 family)
LILTLIGAIGGTIGFIKTRSIPSLIGGILIGSVYGISGHKIQSGQRYGHEIGQSFSKFQKNKLENYSFTNMF